MNSDTDENTEYTRTIVDDIEDINNEINRIENISIRRAWDSVMLPYLKNYNKRELFKTLTENDYDKFYKFFINNNELYAHYVNRMNKLISDNVTGTSNVNVRSNSINKNRNTH